MNPHSLNRISIFQIFEDLSSQHADFRVSKYHRSLLSRIFTSDILIAGVEIVPNRHDRSLLSDSLVCVPVSSLPNVLANLNAHDNGSDDIGYDYLGTASGFLEACFDNTALLCNIDHLWFELDSAPCDNLSFFAGSSSSVQSDNEVAAMLQGASKLVTASCLHSGDLRRGLEGCFENLLAIRQSLSVLAGRSWHISEIGLMVRAAHPHLKVLLTPNSKLSLHHLYEVERLDSSGLLNLPQLPAHPSSLATYTDLPHECKLSVSVTPNACNFAIEVKPEYTPNTRAEYSSFWRHTALLFSRPDLDLQRRMSHAVVASQCGPCAVYSRLHHFKFGVSPDGHRLFKYYRDVRLGEGL